jgi:hypothetical protein
LGLRRARDGDYDDFRVFRETKGYDAAVHGTSLTLFSIDLGAFLKYLVESSKSLFEI